MVINLIAPALDVHDEATATLIDHHDARAQLGGDDGRPKCLDAKTSVKGNELAGHVDDDVVSLRMRP